LLKNCTKQISIKMKKLLIVTGTLFLVAVLYTSCKSHQTCPAYGSVDTEQADKQPA